MATQTKGDRTLHSSKSRRNKKKRRNRIKHKRRSSVDSDSSSFSSNEVSPFEQGYSTSHQWTQSDEDQYRNQAKRHGDEWGSSDKRESSIFPFLAWAESFFANLPLTIGAIALSIASLGVVWFKFAEENMDSCIPVHFHSAQCTFPEVKRICFV